MEEKTIDHTVKTLTTGGAVLLSSPFAGLQERKKNTFRFNKLLV